MSGIINRRDGFTLAELLIVIAIIAVLVGISFPVFAEKMENSRDTVTAANLRSAYTEASEDILNGDIDPQNGVYTVDKAIDVFGTKDGGVDETDGFKYPFKTGSDFSKFGNKKNGTDGKMKVRFTWEIVADSQSGEIQYTDKPTASYVP